MTRSPSWIRDVPLGRLAISPRPAPYELLADDLAGWRDAGAEIVVSLLGDDEMEALGLGEEPKRCEELGLELHRFPITDHGLPVSADAFVALIERLHEQSRQGRGIVAHCYAGIGRSTLVAASLLVRAGLTLDDALERISASRGWPVPDTRAQRQWLEQLEPRLRPGSP
jgi:protein-tyrosine phosphatase